MELRTKRDRLALCLCLALLLAAVLWLSWLFPLTGDDWYREELGQNIHSVGDLIHEVAIRWNRGNARVLGNVLAYSAACRPVGAPVPARTGTSAGRAARTAPTSVSRSSAESADASPVVPATRTLRNPRSTSSPARCAVAGASSAPSSRSRRTSSRGSGARAWAAR